MRCVWRMPGWIWALGITLVPAMCLGQEARSQERETRPRAISGRLDTHDYAGRRVMEKLKELPTLRYHNYLTMWNEVKNGGEETAIGFILFAHGILEELKANYPVGMPTVSLDEFLNALNDTHVDSTLDQDKMKVQGVVKDAWNTPFTFPPLIMVNKLTWHNRLLIQDEPWAANLDPEAVRKVLVFHEYLPIMGENDRSYRISKYLALKDDTYRFVPRFKKCLKRALADPEGYNRRLETRAPWGDPRRADELISQLRTLPNQGECMDLSGENFTGKDLRGLRLVGANLAGALLADAKLQGADLQYANLSSSDARGANFSGARLNESNLKFASFSRASLVSADLVGADTYQTDFQWADARGTDFTDVFLDRAKDLAACKWNRDTVFPSFWRTDDALVRRMSVDEKSEDPAILGTDRLTNHVMKIDYALLKRDGDQPLLGSVDDIKLQGICFQGEPYLVIKRILLKSIDLGAIGACGDPEVVGNDFIRIPKCKPEKGDVFDVNIPRCRK